MNNYIKNKLTLNRRVLQLKMNINVDISFQDDGKVDLVRNLVERMDLTNLVNSYANNGRKPAINPITMLEIFIYAFSEGIYSSRAIEKACRFDLRFHYLLDGQKAPDHSTISRFHKRLEPFIQDILAENTKVLMDEGHVNLSSIYIDGTKIEAYANKYSFVWKKAVLKNQEKLRLQVIDFFSLPEGTTLHEIQTLLNKKLQAIEKTGSVQSFVKGRGKRKSHEQRDYERFQSWRERLEKYDEFLQVMGTRNSFSKTDVDATFMRMKEDHMKNGQLKPGYNIQLASTGQFIIGAYGSHHPNDVLTLPLFLDELYPRYKGKLDRIVCDSGYESIENYTYLDERDLSSYIKPSNYEQAKKRSYQSDISKRENMTYLEEEDCFICANGKKLIRVQDRKKKRASGFEEVLHRYECNECNHCPFQKQCNKYSRRENPQTKRIEFNPAFLVYRQKSYENITSEDGITERINRSIQAEGMFSKLKEGLNYQRFRHKGLRAILCDIHLVALGINLNQLHRKLHRNQFEMIRYISAA